MLRKNISKNKLDNFGCMCLKVIGQPSLGQLYLNTLTHIVCEGIEL